MKKVKGNSFFLKYPINSIGKGLNLLFSPLNKFSVDCDKVTLEIGVKLQMNFIRLFDKMLISRLLLCLQFIISTAL